MPHLRTATAAVLTAGAATAALLLAQGPVEASPANTLRLNGVTSHDTQPARPKAGNNWTTYFTLFEDGGHRVGDGSARCSAVAVTNRGPITQCQRVLRTRNGDLALSGMINRFGKPPFTGEVAVVGGTGRYVGASGQARVTLNGRRVAFVIRLVR